MSKMIELRIKRQDTPDSAPYWQEFLVPHKPGMNVIAALMEIQRNPVTRDGEPTAPVAWESSCLEEVCGACTMLVNGKVRQSCSALIDELEQPISLEPMSKFPKVRDLVVDRSRMFENLKKIQGWVPIDGTFDIGPGPRWDEKDRQIAYSLSRCMTCGCCLEACPQVGDHSPFVGPAVMGQVYYFGFHPSSQGMQEDRVRAVMGTGGITDCGNAQNCQVACPKEVPLLEAIANVGAQATSILVKDIFRPRKAVAAGGGE